MSSTYINASLRRLVTTRANRLYEYCLIHEDDTHLGCQVDHIISEKHNGPTEADNLAYACTFCNRNKGSDTGSIVRDTDQFIRFYNPRTDRWADHFRLNGVIIDSLTEIGEVTVRILGFNELERLLEREALQMVNRYPPDEASIILQKDT